LGLISGGLAAGPAGSAFPIGGWVGFSSMNLFFQITPYLSIKARRFFPQ